MVMHGAFREIEDMTEEIWEYTAEASSLAEAGYGAPNRQHMKKKRRAYEEAEREDKENGEYYGSHYAGECKDFM